jgi:FlaG/FlaF family flagellin (archaellin)
MSSQAAVKKNKKGLSVIIGYVLLMVISIVMSALVYQWLKTYVPKDSGTCDDGTSMFINKVDYNCNTGHLIVTVKNNGRFGIDGYIIHASNRSGEEIPIIDLSVNLITSSPTDRAEHISGNEVRFSNLRNSLSPQEAQSDVREFDTLSYGRIYKIEIIPVRIQDIENQKRTILCNNAKSETDIICNTN